ncbi:hypothetical protein BAL199_12511 [alpha proteobacterium BAL199]|nr:hypothetical protein BAL199_12511 [alpha proteobacterium BAL199]
MTLALMPFGISQANSQAARVCAPQATALVAQLGKEYGEVLTAAGVDANGGFVQVYTNTQTGTWTIAITIPGGPTCIVSAGEGWVHEQTAGMQKPGLPS